MRMLTRIALMLLIATPFTVAQSIPGPGLIEVADDGVNFFIEDHVMADFDGDGDPDVITVAKNAPSFLVQFMKNDGNLSFTHDGDGGPAAAGKAITTGDFDNDGKLDVAILTEAPSVIMLFNDTTTGGTSSFSFGTPIETFLPPGSAGDITSIEFSGDGVDDIVVAIGGPAGGLIALQSAAARLPVPQMLVVPGTTGPTFNSLERGDVDGLGGLDVIATTIAGNVKLVTNLGAGVFASLPDVFFGGNVLNAAAGDVDGDGVVDLMASGIGLGTSLTGLVYAKGVSAGSFGGSRTELPMPAFRRVAVGNFDGIGGLDVVAIENGPRFLHFFSDFGNPAGSSHQVLDIGDDLVSVSVSEFSHFGAPLDDVAIADRDSCLMTFLRGAQAAEQNCERDGGLLTADLVTGGGDPVLGNANWSIGFQNSNDAAQVAFFAAHYNVLPTPIDILGFHKWHLPLDIDLYILGVPLTGTNSGNLPLPIPVQADIVGQKFFAQIIVYTGQLPTCYETTCAIEVTLGEPASPPSNPQQPSN